MQNVVAHEIRPARPDDWVGLLELLSTCGLPPDGLREHLGTLLVTHDKGRIIGSAALELYETAALLRSVAVAAPYRGQGLGHRLTEAALDLARARGMRDVYLLTETAHQFFPRFGFGPVGRDEVPESVKGSVEFTTACPKSAAAMR